MATTSAARPERTRSLRPGDRVARKLELLRPLAEGGMGTVWVARNLTTQAEVAIKVLRAGRDDGAHAAERFRHEARLGAMLTHRNITRVFDLLDEDDGSLVLVMELLHGETLEASYKARGTLSSREAVAIIVPILGALQHAHGHGVVHRDIKPSNIFLHVDPDGHTTPKLLDLGIAKTHDGSVQTRAGDALGTPSYMSPEQVRASKQLDGRSDLFSVGVVLYEILTGGNPFHAEAPSAALAQVLELEIDPDPRIEPRVWLEIQRALSKQAYERHASAVELADALSRAMGASPVELPRRDKPAPPADPPRSDAPRSNAPRSDGPRSDGPRTLASDVPPEVPRRASRGRVLVMLGAALALALAAAATRAVLLRSASGSASGRLETVAAESGATETPTQRTATATATAPASAPAARAASSEPVTALEEPRKAAARAATAVAPSPHAPKVKAPRPSPPAAKSAASVSAPSVARTPGF